MARPCKSAALLTECSQTKAETDFRLAQELSLKGDADNLSPPEWLNDNQKYIFTSIVNGLKEAGILGELDIYLLTECAVSIDRLQAIEQELKRLSELVALGLLHYEPNKLYEVNFENAKCTYDTNMNRFVNKEKSSGKVDEVVATINALYPAMQNESGELDRAVQC